MQVYIAYVPVLHEGYRRFFETNPGPKKMFLFGSEITAEFPWLAKEIRELHPDLMQKAIESLGIFDSVSILDKAQAQILNIVEQEIILPDEDISHILAQKYFQNAQVTFNPIFLRWDKHNSIKEKPIVPEEYITHEEFHNRILSKANIEAAKSSDIWRHVGAAIVKNGEMILIGHNAHVPSEHMPYVNGDPRNNFHKGDHLELSTALHAEAGLIAEAARQGISLEGTDIYVTVFPCPPCAKLIAYSGIKNIYCGGGYAVLDGEYIMKSRGVKIYFVE